MRDNIAVIDDINFFNLLEEYDSRFIFFKDSEDEESLVKELEKFSIRVVLIGENSKNLKEKAKFISDMNIDVIVFGSGINFILMRELFKADIIENYFFKSEVELILECIKNSMEREKYADKISLKIDLNSEKIVEINEIVSIQYDRIKRRTIFSSGNREYFLTKNLSEVEEYISNYKNFYRVDRSVIININAIDIILHSEECIVMNDGSRVYVSQSKIREVKLKLKDKIMFI